jgi:FkbM family methyltransferase
MLIEKHGVRFEVVESSNKSFWKNAFINGWEQSTYNFLFKYLNPNKIFIDIGSWIGPVSLIASQNSRHCLCFEPDEIAYNEFKSNIQINNIKNISLEKLAVSNRKQITLGANELGTSVTSNFNSTNQFTSDCISLENIFRKYNLSENDISVIKIDVEGHECELLQDEFLLNLNLPIHVSFHYGFAPNKEDFIQGVTPFLLRRGYNPNIVKIDGIDIGFDKI